MTTSDRSAGPILRLEQRPLPVEYYDEHMGQTSRMETQAAGISGPPADVRGTLAGASPSPSGSTLEGIAYSMLAIASSDTTTACAQLRRGDVDAAHQTITVAIRQLEAARRMIA